MMEKEYKNEIKKKRKTNDKNYVNYYMRSRNLNRIYENNSSSINSKFKNENKCNKIFNLNADHNKPLQKIILNKNLNIKGKYAFSNNKNNFINSNINNVNNNYGNINNKKSKLIHHPFLNESSRDEPIFIDDEINKIALDIELPSKIYISENFKNNYIDDTSLKKNENKNKIDKIGLSSNEYNSYQVETKNNVSYEHALKLNKLWNIYVNELLELSYPNDLTLDTINEMELNGAYIEIHKSRCSTYIGIKGIIILETENSFKIITPKNKVLILLKNKSVFIIKIKDKLYYLHGVQLLRDPALKSQKKYKMLQNRII